MKLASKVSYVYEQSRKESWQIEFENEFVNDDEWNCVVVAAVEAEAEDEESIRVFNESLENDPSSAVQSISMADLITAFKFDRQTKSSGGKSKTGNLAGTDSGSGQHSQILQLVSKYAIFVDGQCQLHPELMAYALKYLILKKKTANIFSRKIKNYLKIKERDREMRLTIATKALPEIVKGNGEKDRDLKKNESRRDSFDLLEGLNSSPYMGPDMFIVLNGFYDPEYFIELEKINVPLIAILRVERVPSQKAIKISAMKKEEWIANFWEKVDREIEHPKTTHLYQNFAFVKYRLPRDEYLNHVPGKVTKAAEDINYTLFSVYNIHRLYKMYLSQMVVEEVPIADEVLDLDQCEVYLKLTDLLVKTDAYSEILILFAMIEEVVASELPERIGKKLYNQEGSGIFSNPQAGESLELSCLDGTVFSPNNLASIAERSEEESKKAKMIFYGDSLSFHTVHIDKRLIRLDALFRRFLVNWLATRISGKYPTLTEEEKAFREYQYYRLCCSSREQEHLLRLKVYFAMVIKLIADTKEYTTGTQVTEVSSQTALDFEAEARKGPLEITEENAFLSSETFKDILPFFYPETQISIHFTKETTSKQLRAILKKAKANQYLVKKKACSYENLENACGIKQKFQIDLNSSEEPKLTEKLKRLQQMLEAPDISILNQVNCLTETFDANAFSDRFHFYENLEPNRMAQTLMKVLDTYNTVHCTYLSPTDTLFVLGFDEFDGRGVFVHFEKGFLDAPVAFREFLWYVLPHLETWARNQNEIYLQYLRTLKSFNDEKTHAQDHALRCGLLKLWNSLSEAERSTFVQSQDVSQKGSKNGKPKEKEREKAPEDLPDLPKKTKLPHLSEKIFFGFDTGSLRKQVTESGYKYYSKDGCSVFVKKTSWLYENKVLTVIVKRGPDSLYFHKREEDSAMSLHLRDSDEMMLTFYPSGPEGFRSALCQITWPTGLTVKPVRGTTKHFLYVKQSYLAGFRNETSRCCLPNGQVLIFRSGGTVDVYFPSGTVYRCKKFSWENYRKTCRPFHSDSPGKIKEVELYEELAPTGELWLRDDCSKCKRLSKTMIVLTGVDAKNCEIFTRREDGTNSMLWGDGKLVTTYPDGTKITSVPEFEENEIHVSFQGSSEFEQSSAADEPRSARKDSQSKEQADGPKVSFPEGTNEKSSSNNQGFVPISCSYLIEHPEYATIRFGDTLQLTFPGERTLTVNRDEVIRYSSSTRILNLSQNLVSFANNCRLCGKMSISELDLNPELENSEVICKTDDYYNNTFLVFGSGRVLYKAKEISEQEEKASGEDCKHDCDPCRERCLVVERDLTGLEFIRDNVVHNYFWNLSPDCYYDLHRVSETTQQIRHGFFDPVYEVGQESWRSRYEKNDGVPSNLKRNDLILSRESCSVQVRKTYRSRSTCETPEPKRAPKMVPKLIVARFFKLLHPFPSRILREISNLIVAIQGSAQAISKSYESIDVPSEHQVFGRYVAKELQLIAEALCGSLQIYPHTCSPVPNTETDIHANAHKLLLNESLIDDNPKDFETKHLPECRNIAKPLRFEGKCESIAEEVEVPDTDQGRSTFVIKHGTMTL